MLNDDPFPIVNKYINEEVYNKYSGRKTNFKIKSIPFESETQKTEANLVNYGFEFKANCPDVLTTLEVDGQHVMDDGPFERYTNKRLFDSAYGNVVVIGAGLLMLPLALLKKENVNNTVFVIEKNYQLVNFLSSIKTRFSFKKSILWYDIFNLNKEESYNSSVYCAIKEADSIIVDIWPELGVNLIKESHEIETEIRRINSRATVEHWGLYESAVLYKEELDMMTDIDKFIKLKGL